MIIGYSFWDISKDYFGTLIGIFLGCCLGLCIGSLISLIFGSFLISSDFSLEKNIEYKKPVYSVVDNSGVDGSFFLGCGKVDSELKYYYVVKEDLGEKIKSVYADNTYIKKTDGQPVIKKYSYDFENKWHRWLGVCWKDDVYILEVPDDTVKYEYNVNMR